MMDSRCAPTRQAHAIGRSKTANRRCGFSPGGVLPGLRPSGSNPLGRIRPTHRSEKSPAPPANSVELTHGNGQTLLSADADLETSNPSTKKGGHCCPPWCAHRATLNSATRSYHSGMEDATLWQLTQWSISSQLGSGQDSS